MKNNFFQRLWTSFIILALFLVLFAISGVSPAFEIAVAVMICLCLYEALTCVGCVTNKKMLIPSLSYGAIVPLSFIARDTLFPGRNPYFAIIVISIVYLLFLFLLLMINFEKTRFSDAAVVMVITFTITCFLTNLIFIRRLEPHGFFFMFLCI